MDIEQFTLPVNYNNQDYNFPAELRVTGFAHKVFVTVNEIEVMFEPDEERNYRAIVPDNTHQRLIPDMKLLAAIAGELEIAFK